MCHCRRQPIIITNIKFISTFICFAHFCLTWHCAWRVVHLLPLVVCVPIYEKSHRRISWVDEIKFKYTWITVFFISRWGGGWADGLWESKKGGNKNCPTGRGRATVSINLCGFGAGGGNLSVVCVVHKKYAVSEQNESPVNAKTADKEQQLTRRWQDWNRTCRETQMVCRRQFDPQFCKMQCNATAPEREEGWQSTFFVEWKGCNVDFL